MKRRRAAVLILGAGPAGCAAAITARLAGLSVVLLEAHAAPRAQPGETLHPGVEPIFRQLGVWEALVAERFPRQRGLWREGENGARVFEPYGHDTHGPWLGFQADRVRLGGLLRARAVALGGKIIRVARVDAVLRGESAVAGVRAEGCEYHASAVLDATGRQNRGDIIEAAGESLPLRRILTLEEIVVLRVVVPGRVPPAIVKAKQRDPPGALEVGQMQRPEP